MTFFNNALTSLLESLRSHAVGGGSHHKFATGHIVAPVFNIIYALVQCTPDLTQSQCYSCLTTAFGEIPGCCQGQRAARIVGPNCNVRYDAFLFYGITDDDMPQAPQHRKGETVKLILIAGCVILILCISSCIYMFLWVRKLKRKIESKSYPSFYLCSLYRIE